jgi:hypothetical protein
MTKTKLTEFQGFLISVLIIELMFFGIILCFINSNHREARASWRPSLKIHIPLKRLAERLNSF